MALKAVTSLRPSDGGLHLGHYIGNIKPLIDNQYVYDCTFIFADLQCQNASEAELDSNIDLMLRQMICLGVDVNRVKFIKESTLKKDRLDVFLDISRHLTSSRIKRLPMIKSAESLPMSFFVFPIFQIMDIYLTDSSIAFSNTDNKAVIELTNEVFKKINKERNASLPHVELIHGKVDVLVGFDGKKMSKKNQNCINFLDSEKDIRKKVNKMYTDPNRIHADDAGNIAGNIVFKYLDAFFDCDSVKEYERMYSLGKIGDAQIKTVLSDYLCKLIIQNQFKVEENKKSKVLDFVN